MRHTLVPSSTIGGGVAAIFLLCGCPNPNTYTTARTLDPGKFQGYAAAEGIGFSFDNGKSGSENISGSAVLPMAPSGGVPAGIIDNLEIGARVMNFSSLGADVKVGLVRGTFDLALDPGVQFYHYSIGLAGTNTSVSVLYAHLPVLLGFNLSQRVSLVA